MRISEWSSDVYSSDHALPGLRCACGKLGCIDTFLSGTGLEAQHRAATGEALDATEIEARAAAGDAAAEGSLRRYEDQLARALASIINVLDPDVIVLGGGMSKLERLYRSVPAIRSEEHTSELQSLMRISYA